MCSVLGSEKDRLVQEEELKAGKRSVPACSVGAVDLGPHVCTCMCKHMCKHVHSCDYIHLLAKPLTRTCLAHIHQHSRSVSNNPMTEAVSSHEALSPNLHLDRQALEQTGLDSGGLGPWISTGISICYHLHPDSVLVTLEASAHV